MKNNQIITKLNGISCVFMGTFFVFMPKATSNFFSLLSPAPQVMILTTGIALNLFGLLLTWLGNQDSPNTKWFLIFALGNFLWVMSLISTIVLPYWVTSSNGITAAGMMALLMAWFGWQQLQLYQKLKTT